MALARGNFPRNLVKCKNNKKKKAFRGVPELAIIIFAFHAHLCLKYAEYPRGNSGVWSADSAACGQRATYPKDGFTHVQRHIPASLTAPRRRIEAELLYQTHRNDAIFKNPSRSSRHRKNRTPVTAARPSNTPWNATRCNTEVRKALSTWVSVGIYLGHGLSLLPSLRISAC